MSKNSLYEWGTAQNSAWRGLFNMNPRDEYLLRAAELNAMAQAERDHADKREFENLARAYLRLARQAERTARRMLSAQNVAEKNLEPTREGVPRTVGKKPEV